MEWIRLLQKKGDCQLFSTQRHQHVQSLLEDAEHEGRVQTLIAHIKTNPAFRSYVAADISKKVESFERRADSDILPLLFFVDIEACYVYYLFLAQYVEERQFPELYRAIERMRPVLDKTAKFRELAMDVPGIKPEAP